MYQSFIGGLGTLPLAKHGKSRSINCENPHGEKGRGGMAESPLGPSRKGAPCIQGLAPGSVTTLAEIEGSGVIQHIWMTVTDRTDIMCCGIWCCACTGMMKRHRRWRRRWETSSAAASGEAVR